jgi:UDP-N-acetylmuramate dehydrogenase
MENKGKQLLREDDRHWLVQAESGENWHELVAWTLAQGWPGLENLALIPGNVGATPVQNIGAYGVELQDVFDSLDAIDLESGELFSLDAAQCAFAYRDSVFKHGPGQAQHGSRYMGLAGRAAILRVRFRLSKKWRPVLGYADIQRKIHATGQSQPTALEVFDWVCEIRRAKLPDPEHLGSAGSFFKNPTVSPEQCADIIAREPKLVHYHLDDGRIKLAAGWLIDACGWRGKAVGNAAVYDRQALVIVNKGGRSNPCTGGEVMTLAKAIQTSVYERFGIRLEPEPVVV